MSKLDVKDDTEIDAEDKTGKDINADTEDKTRKDININTKDINMATDDIESGEDIDIDIEEIDIEEVNFSTSTVESIDLINIKRDEKQTEEFEANVKSGTFENVLKEVWSYIYIFVLALLIALFINNVILVNANVPTSSMENTIMAESRIIGNRLSYIFSEPERGDIVVFENPLDESENYVKRIIGMPGETIEVYNGKIYIYKDGEFVSGPLEEPYLKEEWVNRSNGYVFNIPEDSYLMFGDNRNHSSDARHWSEIVAANPNMYTDPNIIYVKEDKILGKVLFTYWHHGFDFNWIDGENVNY